jgi:hypothetical protein
MFRFPPILQLSSLSFDERGCRSTMARVAITTPLVLVLGIALTFVPLAISEANEALQLHPDNPHYFLWRGKPTVLITSGEHYGAVLNLDFDYAKYLDALAKDQLNLTRTFSGGAYVEPQGAFNIARNTLAPAEGRYITPWARSDQPGYAGGGNKFDLTKWDDAYFQRLRNFVQQAGQRGIVVEMNLFCPMYEDKQWLISPFHAANNINGVGDVERLKIYTLDEHGGLLDFQEKMIRKIVQELEPFDNVYYEITNEPYTRGVSQDWEHHMVDVVVDAQKDHANKKLISLNIANHSAQVRDPHPAVSIFNFHYAAPPDAVAMNFELNKVIGDNETGFRGTGDLAYRSEAWNFLLAGGGLYNNLDYSFTVGHEDGTFDYPATQPGGGNVGFRGQMRVLAEFLNGFDFTGMRPDNSIFKEGMPPDGTARALTDPGQAYAIYLHGRSGPGALVLDLPEGKYTAEWVDVLSGDVKQRTDVQHAGGNASLPIPDYVDDVALRIRRL